MLDLSAAGRSITRPVLTRYAPSPTGYLHLGHVVNAIYVWGVAAALGGRVIIRIEDHDRIRSRAEYEAALLDDLTWLGFLDASGAAAVTRQRERAHLYEEALRALRRQYHVYACDCSRARIGAGAYTGHCRSRRLEEGPGRGLRLRIEPGVERFEDLLAGPMEQEPLRGSGDLLLRDRDGHWTYQFAVVVDDLLQHVSLIIRGADLLSSTGRQLRLARLLRAAWPDAAAPGAVPATYLHHPLVFGPDGRKLSKSMGATAVRALRASGMSPDEVIGRAATAVNLLSTPGSIAAGEVSVLFAQDVSRQ
jgi:glutamyl-tRNA synthetase/glutamyl-Q tRNA(Asp) synthetase